MTPIGELDIATAPVLAEQIAGLQEAGVRHVLLDLRRLAFMDSSGLHLIVRCEAEARRDGFSLEIVRGSDAVHRVFEISGLVSRLPFVDA